MTIYDVYATEQIYEVAHIEAGSKEEAEKIASEDWNVEWDVYDGDFFEIERIEESVEDE